MEFKCKNGNNRYAAVIRPLLTLLFWEDIKKVNVFLDFTPSFTFISDYKNFTLKKLASVLLKHNNWRAIFRIILLFFNCWIKMKHFLIDRYNIRSCSCSIMRQCILNFQLCEGIYHSIYYSHSAYKWGLQKLLCNILRLIWNWLEQLRILESSTGLLQSSVKFIYNIN